MHVNLTRGLDGGGRRRRARDEAELHLAPALGRAGRAAERRRRRALAAAVLVIPLHGHLAPAAWAAARGEAGPQRRLRPGARAAPCPGRSPATCRAPRRGLLAGHVTAGSGHGGEHEAISLAGGIDAAARRLGWDAVVVGPGPGILGSESRLGHGGMAALDAAHAALALGLPTLVSPRLSSSDPRPRHRGLSHHSRTCSRCCWRRCGCRCRRPRSAGWPLLESGAPEGGSPQAALDDLIEVCGGPPRPRRARGSTSTAMRRAACRPGRWGGPSRRTRCSSPRRSPPGRALAEAVSRE